MLKAYFDESYINPTISVCGFIASEEQWQRLRFECAKIYSRFSVPYLHMTELGSLDASAYTHLSQADRFTLVSHIAEQLVKSECVGLCVSINEKSYHSATTERFRSQIATAYTACATAAVMSVSYWLRDKSEDWDVEWTFEHGHANQGQLAERLSVMHEMSARMTRIRKYGFSPCVPGHIPEMPLQLADMLAFSFLNQERSFQFIKHVDSLNHILRLTPALVLKAKGPTAEVEALIRKRRRAAAKGLRILEKLKPGEVHPDEVPEVNRLVEKLNKLAEIMQIDSRLSIIREER